MTDAKLEVDSASASTLVTTRVALPIWLVVFGVTVVGTAIPVGLHVSRHGAINVHQLALSFFFWLNVIIAFWEICLFFRIDQIRGQYDRFKDTYRGKELDRVLEFFGSKIPLSQLLSMSRWAEVWSSYALFDESYADKKSYGFFIDIGNGFSTLIPSLVFIYGITFELVPARALGIIGLLISYQMLYGTLVYFTSFVVNRRYRGHTPGNLAAFVGLTNALWTVFPVWGIAVSIWMIYRDSFAIFGG